MKNRSIPEVVVMLVLIAALVGVSTYFNRHNKLLVNESKSQLTKSSENSFSTSKNLKSIIQERIKKEESSSNVNTNSIPIITAERNYTEIEIQNMTEEKFSELLLDTKKRLPLQKDIKALPPGALHFIPEPILRAGRELGVLKEVLKVHESYSRTAVPFYFECSKNIDHPTTVRALCLTNYIEINKRNGNKINLSLFPDEVVKLSRLVTEI